MKANYRWTNRIMKLLAIVALITLVLHIYANWKISIPLLHAKSTVSRTEIVKAIFKIFWLSSIPVFLFFLVTAIAGFLRRRWYLPFFFVLFFMVGGYREFQEIVIASHDFSQFGAPFTLVAWSSLMMLTIAIAATVAWVIEYQKRK